MLLQSNMLKLTCYVFIKDYIKLFILLTNILLKLIFLLWQKLFSLSLSSSSEEQPKKSSNQFYILEDMEGVDNIESSVVCVKFIIANNSMDHIYLKTLLIDKWWFSTHR